MSKTKSVHDYLCTDCYERLNKLYILHDVPAEYSRSGRGRCALCGFRGELTEIFYHPERDQRKRRYE